MRRSTGNRLWPWAVALAMMAAALLIGAVAHAQSAYVPLTLAQAHAYIDRTNAADPDEIAREIVRLDYLEHAAPVGAMPALTIVLRGRELIGAWSPPSISVGVPDVVTDEGKIAGQTFVVSMPPIDQKDFAPSNGRSIIERAAEDGAFFLAGLLLDHLVLK